MGHGGVSNGPLTRGQVASSPLNPIPGPRWPESGPKEGSQRGLKVAPKGQQMAPLTRHVLWFNRCRVQLLSESHPKPVMVDAGSSCFPQSNPRPKMALKRAPNDPTWPQAGTQDGRNVAPSAQQIAPVIQQLFWCNRCRVQLLPRIQSQGTCMSAAESASRFVVQVCNKRSAASLCKSCMYVCIYIYISADSKQILFRGI